jgi:hypothetical protein
MKNVLALLGGVGMGAFLMYLFDPNSGNRRRALIRDKAVGLTGDITETIDKRSRDLGNRAKGLLQDTKAMFTGGAENEDANANEQQTAGKQKDQQNTGNQPKASGQAA